MKKQLSRLECEYVLSGVAALKPPLEISALPDEGALVSVDSQSYTCEARTRRFFFDDAFIKKSKIPQGAPCSFSFFYKTRRVCFTASIYAREGKSFCRADELFYADDESPFLPSASAKLFFEGEALSGALAAWVHKDFPLDTANIKERMASFSKFAESPAGAAALAAAEPLGVEGILFYLDHKKALACFPPSAAARLSLRSGAVKRKGATGQDDLAKRARALQERAERCVFRLEIGFRKIEAECSSAFRLSRSSLLFCKLSLFGLAPENTRFLYEMSHKEKYPGGELL